MKCRSCKDDNLFKFLDLNYAPPSNAYLNVDDLNKPEVYYPLRILVCQRCYFVQTEDYAAADELFTKDYAYFSSTSSYWLEHCRKYVQLISKKLDLSSSSLVVEIASNDGYLLQHFKDKNIPCLGVEPTQSTADVSLNKGIDTIVDFFGQSLALDIASKYGKADLIIGNNVLAHVPNIIDFVKGATALLNKKGTINFEFPHLLNLINKNQFDTVYHEHFSYLSLIALVDIFDRCDLMLYDVEKLETHGGSLRIYGCHKGAFERTERLSEILNMEFKARLNSISGYRDVQSAAEKTKLDFIGFLIKASSDGKKVAAFGAAAKGNTLLNYCGVDASLLKFVSDTAQSKQGKYLPGSHIPIMSEDALKFERPDFVIVFPWNILPEIMQQIAYIKNWGGRFVVAVPGLTILD
jgi:hypothetical protein